MKAFIRLFTMAIAGVAMAFAASTAGAHAQGFPQCTPGNMTIKNYSASPVRLCLKGIACYDINGHDGINVTLTPGQEVPGVYGVANVTHTWTSPSPMPPAVWIQSQALNPTGNCFDIYFDEASCTILIFDSTISPCLNP